MSRNIKAGRGSTLKDSPEVDVTVVMNASILVKFAPDDIGGAQLRNKFSACQYIELVGNLSIREKNSSARDAKRSFGGDFGGVLGTTVDEGIASGDIESLGNWLLNSE